MEFRVGGRERAQGKWSSGRVSDFQAVYHDIVQDRRIVYSYAMHIDQSESLRVSLATTSSSSPRERNQMSSPSRARSSTATTTPAAVIAARASGLLDALERSLAQ